MSFQRVLDLIVTGACLLIAGVVIEQWVATSGAISPPASLVKLGEPMPSIAGVDFQEADRTLVIVTRSSCPYCEQSAAFWQRLVQARDSTKARVRIVAVSDEPLIVTEKFMRSHGFGVDQVVSATLPLRGTPSLLLVDSKGVVTNGWAGKPPAAAEDEIIRAVLM